MGIDLGNVVHQNTGESDHAAQAFGQMVSQRFLISNAQQRAGLLNHLLDDVSPDMQAALGGSIGQLLKQNGHTRLTAEQAANLTPPQVAEIAVTAVQHNPGIIGRVNAFYEDHPELAHKAGHTAQPAHDPLSTWQARSAPVSLDG
jgi:hypothetical protein